MKLNKKYFFVTALIIISLFSFSFANTILDSVFTPSEHEIIKQSQIKPIKVGIIPNIYPMSVCPPENQKFDGIVVDLLKLISTKSGLQFEFVRIPIEKYSPIRFLKTGEVDAVAGVLKFHTNMEDSEIILSDALFDATVAFVAKKELIYQKKYLKFLLKLVL